MSIIPLCIVHGSFTPSCLHTIIPLSLWHAHPADSTPVCLSSFLSTLSWQRMHVPDKLSLLCIRLCVISFYTVAPCIKACLKAFHTGCHVALSDSLARIKPEKEREGEGEVAKKKAEGRWGWTWQWSHVRLVWCRPDVDREETGEG